MDDKEYDEMILKAAGWLSKAMKQLHCSAPIEVTSTACKKPLKDDLVVLMSEAFHLVRFQNEKLSQMKTTLTATKNKLIENQQWVISLQEQVIDCKDKQLQAVQTTVKTTVEDSVKEQFKSYSDAVQENVMVCKPDSDSLPVGKLKDVVREIAHEEDRLRNVIIFGVPERDPANLTQRVEEVFNEINVKPSVREISFVGKQSAGTSSRPIKVNLSSPSIVKTVLVQAKLLRNSDKLKSVFVKPDLSIEERTERRQLVQDLKQRRASEPDKRHYIRGGAVHSEDTKSKK